MPLQYSCFIGYRNSQDDITQRLVSSLEFELGRWLDMDVYVDKERLKGGLVSDTNWRGLFLNFS